MYLIHILKYIIGRLSIFKIFNFFFFLYTMFLFSIKRNEIISDDNQRYKLFTFGTDIYILLLLTFVLLP